MNRLKFLAIAFALSNITLFSDEVGASGETALLGRPERKVKTNLAATPPAADPCCPAPVCCPVVCRGDNRIQIGANYTYAWVTPTGNPTTSGSLGGVQGIYEYRPENWVYAAAAVNYRQGSTSEDLTDRDILDIDTQERLGYTYAWNAHRVALFTGFGGRYMSEEVSVGAASVTFNYVQFYIPVGFAYDYRFCSSWNWGLNAQWKPQIYPTVQIKPLDGARWMLDKRLDNVYIEMPITYRFGDHFSLIAAPFFEWWHDGASFAETLTGLTLGLPGNEYYFTGLNVNLAWEF